MFRCIHYRQYITYDNLAYVFICMHCDLNATSSTGSLKKYSKSPYFQIAVNSGIHIFKHLKCDSIDSTCEWEMSSMPLQIQCQIPYSHKSMQLNNANSCLVRVMMMMKMKNRTKTFFVQKMYFFHIKALRLI